MLVLLEKKFREKFKVLVCLGFSSNFDGREKSIPNTARLYVRDPNRLGSSDLKNTLLNFILV